MGRHDVFLRFSIRRQLGPVAAQQSDLARFLHLFLHCLLPIPYEPLRGSGGQCVR